MFCVLDKCALLRRQIYRVKRVVIDVAALAGIAYSMGVTAFSVQTTTQKTVQRWRQKVHRPSIPWEASTGLDLEVQPVLLGTTEG